MRQAWSTSSNVRICMLTVDWVRCRSSAALVKLQYSAVATNTSNCRTLISSMLSPF